MAKPRVVIHGPKTLFVAQQQAIEVDITVDDDVKVDYIEARVVCEQGWEVGSGKSRVSHHVRYPQFVIQLMADGVLPAGTTTRFPVVFTLPRGTPPSHELDPAYARTELRLRISIPWRFDPRYKWPLLVRVPAPEHVERTPFAIRSTPMTAAADKPRIELGLPATRLVAGETITGTCAVFHLDDRKPREVELSLAPMLALHGRGRTRERRGDTLGVTITLPAGSAGTGVPFSFRIPAQMTPTFQTVSHELAWWLVARSGSFFGGKVDVSVPLEILDSSAHAKVTQLQAPPRLGDERIATLFAKFAARAGWQGGGTAIDADEDERLAGQFSIERTAGDSHLRLAYAYRGEDGTFVVSRIAHPTLGLDLAIVPSSSLRHVFFEDIEVDIATWDRAHHVSARSPDQTIPVLREVVPALMAADALGKLVRWDDDAIVFERPMSAVDDGQLARMAGDLEQVARAIEQARARIAPPVDAVDLAAWHALATWLEGTLVVGDLSIDGTLDGLPVDLGLEWDATKQPKCVRVSVGDPDAASAEVRAITIAVGQPALEVTSPERLVALVSRWPADFVDLRVVDGVASAALAGPTMLDSGRVRELVEASRAVLVALAPASGPYR